MPGKELDFTHDRISSIYDRISGWSTLPQRFVLDTTLFRDEYQSKGTWRVSSVTRIPIVDQNDPDAGVKWIDARLFSDGYLRGNVKSRSGEIQCIAVEVSELLVNGH